MRCHTCAPAPETSLRCPECVLLLWVNVMGMEVMVGDTNSITAPLNCCAVVTSYTPLAPFVIAGEHMQKLSI